jgi:hypothetical protein
LSLYVDETVRGGLGLENLLVAIAIVLEGILEKFQYLLEAVRITDDFSIVNKGGKHSVLVH